MRHEGVVLHYYNDPVGFCTVGVGHLVRRSRCSSRELNTRISMSRALALLRQDVRRFERAVRRLGVPLNQNRFDALVSIAFNCGEGAIGPGSTIHRRLRAGDYDGAADAFMLWTRAGGRILPGLVARRQVEARLFRKPVARAKKPDPLRAYPADERRWITEYDTLKRRRTNHDRQVVLQKVMWDRRQQVWRAAQPRPRGDGHGWSYRKRSQRYASLRARTPKDGV